MIRLFILSLVLVFVRITGYGRESTCFFMGTMPYKYHTESIISLIANPESHYGENVQVIGYLHISDNPFEPPIIYAYKEDYFIHRFDNGIPISFSKHMILKDGWADETEGKLILVAGTFTSAALAGC